MLQTILSNERKLFEEFKRIVCESYTTNDLYHELLEEYQELDKLDSSWIIDIAKATYRLSFFSIKVIDPCMEGILYLYRNKYQDYKDVDSINISDNYLDSNLKHIYQKLVDIEFHQRNVIIANIECQPHIQSMLHEALNEQDYLWFRNIIFNNGINTRSLSKMLLVSDFLDYKKNLKLDNNERIQVISIYQKILLEEKSSSNELISMLINFFNTIDKFESYSILDRMVLVEQIVIFQTLFLLLLISDVDLNENEIEIIVQQLSLPEFNVFNDGFKEVVKILNFEKRPKSYNLLMTKYFNISDNEFEKLLGIESSFSLPNNYFELPPEKDESLYLGAKDKAIITTEGVGSFSKLINFIVDNNYVKTGEEHNTSTDLKFDLAFKLTGKMQPSILCPKIIWTNSDYTSPLVAIAKGLGGNYDKLKDLFIIDSSFHNRLASIYAERLHTDDKFTNFFYELYPKMKKVNKPTKNNAAN